MTKTSNTDNKPDYVSNHTIFKTENKFKNLKIMIVEDNKVNMLLLKTIIKTLYPRRKLFFEISNGQEVALET
jgi:hypothetical protein